VGGGFPIAPEALLNDGLVDVVLVRPATIARLTTLLPSVLRGIEPESELFQSWHARKGRMTVRPKLPFSLDGELNEGSELRFEVLPGALTICGAANVPAFPPE
jgi:diacylglycerol kinase family enzyme